MRGQIAVVTSLLVALLHSPAAHSQDIQNGRAIFETCLACHDTAGPGPTLKGVYQRKIGSVADFDYSEALIKANTEAKIWDDDALEKFLTAPQTYLPDNKMAFGAVTDRKDRQDVIAYLKTLQ